MTISIVYSTLYALMAGAQLVYYSIFGVYFSAYSMVNGAAAAQFWKVALQHIGLNFHWIVLLLLPMLAVFGVVALANIVFDMDTTYARYDSPDGSHSLVMKNESFLVYEHGEVYVMTSPVTMEKVSDLRTPFSSKYHKIIWYDNYAELIIYEETIRIPLK